MQRTVYVVQRVDDGYLGKLVMLYVHASREGAKEAVDRRHARTSDAPLVWHWEDVSQTVEVARLKTGRAMFVIEPHALEA